MNLKQIMAIERYVRNLTPEKIEVLRNELLSSEKLYLMTCDIVRQAECGKKESCPQYLKNLPNAKLAQCSNTACHFQSTHNACAGLALDAVAALRVLSSDVWRITEAVVSSRHTKQA